MRRYPESRYIVLQEGISAPERRKMARAIAAALPRVLPADTFVERLGRDLVAEATLRFARHQQQQTLKTLGVIGGSVLSIAGGVLLWSLTHRHRAHVQNLLVSGSSAHISVPAGQV